MLTIGPGYVLVIEHLGHEANGKRVEANNDACADAFHKSESPKALNDHRWYQPFYLHLQRAPRLPFTSTSDHDLVGPVKTK